MVVMDHSAPQGGVAMNMKPCNFDQELLFSLLRVGTVWERVRMGWHCLFCSECRLRRAEFAAASKALMTLRPSSAAMSAAVPGSSRTRLIMCSAALAVAAAVLSYYLSGGGMPFIGAEAAQAGSANAVGTCDPVPAKVTKKDPSAAKPGRKKTGPKRASPGKPQ